MTQDPDGAGRRTPARRGLAVRMRARDIREEHRASSPLELLFDLTFVAAVSIASGGFAHEATVGHPITALAPFAFAFFAIWWAWMNFTWFASAYDTDDVPYRLLTVLQMVGVLVLAAGLSSAYVTANVDNGIVTAGYVVMRLALVAQWLRAGLSHPDSRAVALRYAAGVTVVQVGWVLRLLLPETWMLLTASLALAVCELIVPPWAERGRGTSWNAAHIGERYGLFVIILLGEGMLGATAAVQSAVRGTSGPTLQLVAVGVLGLVVVVGLWWLYFLVPAERGLSTHRALAWLWGYGHCVPLAALALVGAGLELAVEAGGHPSDVAASRTAISTVAWAAALFLAALVALNRPLLGRRTMPWGSMIAAALLLAAAPLLAPLGIVPGLLWVVCILAAVVARAVTTTVEA